MQHYLSILQSTIKSHWTQPALCQYRGETLKYSDIAEILEKFHILFEKAGIKKGDKISLCARNTNRWAVSFLAVNTYEAVIVPILADFHPDNVNYLVDHSDSILLFTDSDICPKLDFAKMPKLKGIINIDDFSLVHSNDEEFTALFKNLDANFKAKYPQGLKPEDVSIPVDNMGDLAVINYTSGTTSAPKGVMLRYECISASVDFALRRLPVYEGDKLVSMLPMAHIYGLVFEFIYPLCGGAAVYFLGKAPAPSLLLKAMKDVKPYLVITVPLVLEKVYKSSLKPVLSKPAIKILSAIPGINQLIFKKVRTSLQEAFGGNTREFIMGGAALNPEVEDCFRRIKLPYTVGYGMTEAAPLLAYEGHKNYAKGSCGKKVDCADVRIDSADPQNIVGEIQAKGINICSGYYKNEAATQAAFTADGYLRTGDLGVIDAQGNIFIRGRSKNMILSANGQNIYPEEIEALINTKPYAVESVVVDRSGKLVALIYLDNEAMEKAGLDAEAISDVPENIRLTVNKELPGYSQIAKVEVMGQPFEKTPKMSIKRFLYK